jgi:DNA-binding Lrp family transcriptional regulator
MDKYDRVIISELAANARASAAEIADAVHLSRSAVTRRIQALEDKGTLLGYHADLSTEQLGWAVQAMIILRAPSYSHEQVASKVMACPEVLSLRILSGAQHFLIEAVLLSTGHMREFLRGIQVVGETETHLVFNTYRSGFSVMERLQQFEKKQVSNATNEHAS